MEETTDNVSRCDLKHDASMRTLSDESVQILVVGSLDTEVSSANVVDGLVVDHEGAVGVLERGVCSKDGVVRLDDRCCDLRSWVDAEFQLAFLAVVD